MGTPTRTVCPGSPREMGRAQGAALRASIAGAWHDLGELAAFRQRQPWWLPFRAYRRLAARKARRFLAAPLGRDLPGMGERLTGIAEGARLSVGAISLFNAMEPLLSSVGGCTACPGACSAVAVRGRRSATGVPIVARNFDYLPLVQPYYAMRESRPSDGLRSLDFTLAPLAGAVDGMNEAGLCITYDYAFATDDPTSPAPPISMLIAEALRLCKTVAEAADWITARPRWGGGLLMLADADGDIASLELSSSRSFLRRPAPGEDVLFHTNDFRDATMRAVQIADDAIYTDAAPEPLRGRRLHQSSELRNERYQALLDATAVFSPDELAAVMADHGAKGTPDDFTPCVHGTYWSTTACLQFYPRSRRLRVSYSTACQARFVEMGL